jgi:hypothetical protein
MWTSSHVRLVFKNGTNIQMDFENHVIFVSKDTEISVKKFVTEYFTPLTLNLQTGVISTEVWESVKEETIEKVRGRGQTRP